MKKSKERLMTATRNSSGNVKMKRTSITRLPSWLGLPNTPIASLQRSKTPPKTVLVAQLTGAAEYSDRVSSEGQDSPYKCPRYITKQSGDGDSVMLELYGMWTISSLSSLPGRLWSGVVAPDRVLSKRQIEINCVRMLS